MEPAKFFPVAVWYNGSFARAPMMARKPLNAKMIKRDLKLIKEQGFNSIKYWVDWATCNPKEDILDFAQVKHFFSLLNGSGLKVIVQIYLDSAPNWIAAKYPDSLFVSQAGHKVESQASPGYSLDHPEVRKAAGIFLEKLSGLLRDEKALYAWDVWSEPHVVNWSWFDYMGQEPWFDYNEHSRLRFIEWLKGKYKNIGDLNAAWYRTYSSWDEIRMPKYVTLSTYQDIIDLQLFTVNKMKEDLAFRVEKVRSGDPNHLITSHSAITSIMSSIMDWGANGNDWEMSKVVDVWGTSYYPAHIGSLNPYDPALSGLFLDASRSACDSSGVQFWIGELQCGQAVEGLKFGIPVGPEEISKWTWACISSGAKGLFYYAYYPMSCGEEISGFGMISFSGEPNARSLQAGKIANIIANNSELFINSKPPRSDVAIMVNVNVSAMLAALRTGHNRLIGALVGTYRILYSAGIYPDFIDYDNLTPKTLSSYSVVFSPLMFSIDETHSRMLAEFVRNGGTLLSEFRPGWSNLDGETTCEIPGQNLADLFGAKEEFVSINKESYISASINGWESKFAFNDAIEVLTPLTSEVIGKNEDGKPVITRNKFGRGNAILSGIILSSYFEKNRTEDIKSLVLNLIKDSSAGQKKRSVSSSQNVEIRQLISGQERILLAFNHTNSPVSSVKIYTEGTFENMTDMISNKKIPFRKTKESIEMLLDFDPAEVKVIRMR